MGGIVIEHVNKSFGDQAVLKDVCVTWHEGKIHGLIGQNGCGKTVLLKCICGLMRYDSGVITVDGQQIGKDIEMPQSLGVIIETPGFLQRLSGYRNLKMLASIRGVTTDQQIKDAMQIVNLDWKNAKAVSHYSLGMRQRLGIAQAIMEEPKWMIFDEPFNGLDKHGASEMRQLFLRLQKQGKTLLIVSHNPLDIHALCDTVSEMDAGEVHQIVVKREELIAGSE